MSNNFNAAEQHFRKIEMKLRQDLNRQKVVTESAVETAERLTKENNELQKEYHKMKEKLDKMLEYSLLTEEDLIQAIERDKATFKATMKTNESLNMLVGLGKQFGLTFE